LGKRSGRYTYPCWQCGGHGHVELSGVYSDTLDLLRRQNTPLSGSALSKLAGCSNESMCNRLRAIERHGLARSKRSGKERLWTAA
jgi:hypothetical protein